MTDRSAERAEQEARLRPHPAAWLVLPGMLAAVLLGVLAGRWLWPQTEVREGQAPIAAAAPREWRPTPRPEGETFALTIDFGNGAQRQFAALPWRQDMTVLAAMQAAAEFRPGITFAYTGQGETAFLTSIDGVKNAGGDGGNWIYEINGEKPPKSMGLQALQAGDALLWRYSSPP